MTVDTNLATATSPSTQSGQTLTITRRNRQDVIKTIQEITPFDENTINRAIEACQDNEGRYSIDQVLNVLMDDRNSYEYPQENKNIYNNMSYSGSGGGGGGVGTSAQRGYQSNNDDQNVNYKQTSKQGFYQQNSRNNIDNDYSSINDDEEINNESDLIRDNLTKPCGLKNVGNTCWFNSIIQALFHLPYFRKLLLSYQITVNSLDRLDDNSKNVVQFIFELRKLFALLLKSKRKAINPNTTLRVLRNCSRYNVSNFNQEDVSEFSTILVNLIEESFDILTKLEQTNENRIINDLNINESPIKTTLTSTSAISINNINTEQQQQQQQQQQHQIVNSINNDDKDLNTRKNRKNPIVNLLNGDLLISRKNIEDVSTSRTETFREINIQMLNSRNLHEGLELEWGETSIDAATNSNAKALNESLYEQESWVMQLPPVLFICLNRYKFVKATQSSSKILEPFEFYQHIYLDRYMYSNRELIKHKRKELKLLKNELQQLEEKLNTIKSHNFNSKQYALDDVLNCTLNFASTNHQNELFENLAPKPNSNHFSIESINESLNDNEKNDKINLNSLKICLESWIKEILKKINDLENSIKLIKEKIDKIYDDNDLKKVKYNLHSVCVHEGSAALGHFWTYIWNKQQQKWYKFNDTEVCESNWDDLYANAKGGVTSAYFLIYINANDDNLYQENNELTSDLDHLLENDQNKLNHQLSELRLKLILKDYQEKLKKLQPITITSNDVHQTCVEHAKAFNESTLESFQTSVDKLISDSPEDAFKFATVLELNKYIDTAKDIVNKLPDYDPRTLHILTYLSANNIQKDYREFALIDIFRIQIFPDTDIRIKILQAIAQIKYYEIYNDPTKQEFIKQYEKLQSEYRDFRSIIAAFITACTQFEVEKYQEAAEFFCVSCEFNERVTNGLRNKMKGMDHELLLKCRRKCLKMWNQSIIKKISNFRNIPSESLSSSPRLSSGVQRILPQSSPNVLNNLDADVISYENIDRQRLIEIMIHKFLPCFNRLSNSTNEDKQLIEEIRQDWLSILDSNLAELPIFQDFMAKIFEEPYGNHYHQLTVNKSNLYDRYKDTVAIMKNSYIKQ